MAMFLPDVSRGLERQRGSLPSQTPTFRLVANFQRIDAERRRLHEHHPGIDPRR
jgi:hypothetical protein